VATTKSVGFAVDSPPVAAAPFGVVNRLTLQDDTIRWEGGVGFASLACGGKIDLVGVCHDETKNLVDGTGRNSSVYGAPFGITAVDTCTSTMSGSAFREAAEGRVEMLLEAATPKAVEWELKWGWEASAAAPQGRWLTEPQTVVVDSSGVAPRVAMALLEDAYAGCSYGGGGMLHMTPGSAALIPDKEIVDEVLFNSVGTPIIAGAGYAATGTEVTPWDGTWMFITGPVYVWLGDVAVYPDNGQAVNITTNDILFKAERLAAVTFDSCCTFAVKVDVTNCC
jgi:hypothetical protein